MKVMHVPFCFYPDPVGGTEIYVETLGNHLQNHNIEIVIVAPAQSNAKYNYGSLPVRRFAISSNLSLSNQYALDDTIAKASISKIIDDEKPDIIHLHALTSAASVHLVRAARDRKIPVVFTYHTPTVTCARGTLLQWGNEVCDGEMIPRLCAQCNLNQHGLAKPVSQFFGSIPIRIGKMIGDVGLSGDIWTTLRMQELVEARHHATQALFEEVHQIVVMTKWTQDVLIRNQVPAAKIRLVRHGVHEKPASNANSPYRQEDHLKLVYIGRLNPIKGIHILLKALEQITDLPLRLDIYGIVQPGDEQYLQTIEPLIHNDPRITLNAPVPHTKIMPLLKDYHALVLPSQSLETGPLVMLEALAAGIPVIGSNLGGINEWIQHNANGLLVEPSDVESWKNSLTRLIQEPGLWKQLCLGISPPPTMADVTKSMMEIYTAL